MIWKYKVGDIVLVRKEIAEEDSSVSTTNDGRKFPITEDMKKFANKYVTISELIESQMFPTTPLYKIEEDRRVWSEPIFEYISELFD